jgi:uncharacterized membrane protein YphA (DoxX/SURF4 family)
MSKLLKLDAFRRRTQNGRILRPTMASHPRNIYVQITIRGTVDCVWQLSQTPALHQKWDLRFTDIQYLPRPDTALPQRFLYATRLAFGLTIRGQGETIGNHDGAAGQRSSALKFWSEDRRSLIREGSGYWKYVPCVESGQTVRFLTGFDYNVRFGIWGRVVDRLVFRPLIGWATAWSFDRLRLWIEEGIDPATSMQRSLTNLIARLALAFVWLYQGIVPKLIFHHADELFLLRGAGLSAHVARPWCVCIGWAEVAIGLALLVAWRSRWPLWVTLIAMPAAAIAVTANSPAFLTGPFNPVTLNLAAFALALIAAIGTRNLPSASRCLRRPSREET